MGAFPDRPWPVPVTPLNGVSVGTVMWRQHGAMHMTVVVKASFAFARSAAMTLAQPQPIRGPEQGALYELAPFHRKVDVWLSGHARAQAGTAPVPFRFVLSRGSDMLIDKRVELTVSAEAARSGYVPLTGFGAIRPAVALDTTGKLLEVPAEAAADAFQSAPADQRVDKLVGDEWIGLSGLDPTLGKMATQLPMAKAKARAYTLHARGFYRDVTLYLSSLGVDVDKWQCSLIWRGYTPLDESMAASVLVAAGVELPGQPLRWRDPFAEVSATTGARSTGVPASMAAYAADMQSSPEAQNVQAVPSGMAAYAADMQRAADGQNVQAVPAGMAAYAADMQSSADEQGVQAVPASMAAYAADMQSSADEQSVQAVPAGMAAYAADMQSSKFEGTMFVPPNAAGEVRRAAATPFQASTGSAASPPAPAGDKVSFADSSFSGRMDVSAEVMEQIAAKLPPPPNANRPQRHPSSSSVPRHPPSSSLPQPPPAPTRSTSYGSVPRQPVASAPNSAPARPVSYGSLPRQPASAPNSAPARPASYGSLPQQPASAPNSSPARSVSYGSLPQQPASAPNSSPARPVSYGSLPQQPAVGAPLSTPAQQSPPTSLAITDSPMSAPVSQTGASASSSSAVTGSSQTEVPPAREAPLSEAMLIEKELTFQGDVSNPSGAGVGSVLPFKGESTAPEPVFTDPYEQFSGTRNLTHDAWAEIAQLRSTPFVGGAQDAEPEPEMADLSDGQHFLAAAAALDDQDD